MEPTVRPAATETKPEQGEKFYTAKCGLPSNLIIFPFMHGLLFVSVSFCLSHSQGVMTKH